MFTIISIVIYVFFNIINILRMEKLIYYSYCVYFSITCRYIYSTRLKYSHIINL
ncbi:hypothetical protein C1646_686824 [Rhizophagus diaphanus]|nr:hypothetical protein C1646_686824 [Rhizophagus diaphanus] [Rhizophagus sp. MUCL 43196]